MTESARSVKGRWIKIALIAIVVTSVGAGFLYQYSQGDLLNAIKFRVVQALAYSGSDSSQRMLGYYYLEGKGVEQSDDIAFQWFLSAAKKGDAFAQLAVAIAYSKGDGVEPDAKIAVDWYRKAANAGLGYAQYNLGICYYNGLGIQHDVEMARQWWQRASVADKYVGDEVARASATYLLGMLLLRDDYENADPKQGRELLHRAANSGFTKAQFELGMLLMSESPDGGQLHQALKWLLLAARDGHAEAVEALLKLKGQIKKEDMEGADLLVRAWKADNI